MTGFNWPQFLDVPTARRSQGASFGGEYYLFVPANGGNKLLLTVTDNLSEAAGVLCAGQFYRGKVSRLDAQTLLLTRDGQTHKMNAAHAKPVTATFLQDKK